MPSSAPTPSPSSLTTAPTPSKFWWGFGLTATASTLVGVVVFMFLRCRRRLAFSGRSIAGVEVLSAPLTSEANSDDHMISVDGSGAHRAADFHGSGFEGVEVSVNSDGTWMPVEGLNEPLTPEAHSDQMISADGSDAQSSGGIWMPPLSSAATVPRDAQGVDGIRMTPVSSTVTARRYARDLDGISPSSWQLLLRESAAPAFMGEGLSLVPKPTRTNIHAHPRHSELEPRGGHVEQGPH